MDYKAERATKIRIVEAINEWRDKHDLAVPFQLKADLSNRIFNHLFENEKT